MERNKFTRKTFLLFFFTVQVVVCIAIFLDIPFVRQIVGFIYLAFIPGFALLNAYRPTNLNITEIILFSVGLSLTFLMVLGLFINYVGPLVFTSAPLSTEPLIMLVGISIFVVCVFSYFKNKEDIPILASIHLKLRHLLPYFILPILGISGIMLSTALENNFLLLLTIIIIPVLFVLAFFYKPSSHYPFILVAVAFTLLLTTFLASYYIQGHDIHRDYFVFSTTMENSYWDLSVGQLQYYRDYNTVHLYNSMLSVTILPTILSIFLNVDGIWLFNVFYPLIFSLVPLALFQLLKGQWGKKIAFLSVFFFISNTVFFDFQNTVKAMVAEFFFLLLFLVLFKKDMDQRGKWIFLIVFSFALIVSYYTMSYIFLSLLFLIWFFTKLFNKNDSTGVLKIALSFFAVLTFSWYMFTNVAPFMQLELALRKSFIGFFEELFVPSTRGSLVSAAIGITSPPTFLHQLARIFFNINAGLIFVGFLVLILKRYKKRLNPQFFYLTLITMVFLLMVIIVPNFSEQLQMGRIYHIALLFLSPLFVLGGRVIFNNVFKVMSVKNEKKRRTYSLILILVMMSSFFLFQTGFVYEVAGDPVPSSIPLSKYRMDDRTLREYGMFTENDFFGATWLSKYVDVDNSYFYSDTKSKLQELTSSMVTIDNNVEIISNTTNFMPQSYVYLSRYNTKSGILLYNTVYPNNVTFPLSNFSIFNSTTVINNKLYSNGACEIYQYDGS